MAAAEAVSVAAGDLNLSGLAIQPDGCSARGLVLALHGGGYSAGYWHNQGDDGLSFLDLASSVGFHVLAVDRPGYGALKSLDQSPHPLQDQVSVLYDVIDSWCERVRFDGPLFVIGHSIGGKVALLMAADPRSARLCGVDVLGVPLRLSSNEAGADLHALESDDTHIAPLPEHLHRSMMFGREGSFSKEALDFDRSLLQPTPMVEYRDAMRLTAMLPSILRSIELPVHMTLADAETMQETGPDIVRLAESLLVNSRHARVSLQRGSGHNASAHRIARAYHLRAIAFFEECLALRDMEIR